MGGGGEGGRKQLTGKGGGGGGKRKGKKRFVGVECMRTEVGGKGCLMQMPFYSFSPLFFLF